jgi:glycosyltransferase involved in cell wall biosynthesis
VSCSAPIRVHVLIDSLTWGGAELLLAQLGPEAKAHGIELSVGYLYGDAKASGRRLRNAGLEPQPVGAGRLADPRTLLRVHSHLARARPDVVHTQLQYADLVGGVAAGALRVPAVSTVHVLDDPVTPRDRLRRRLVTLGRRHCHARVLAVSEHLRAEYLATAGDRPDHVVTVHNGIAARAQPGAGACVREELGIASDAIVAAVVAVLRPGKGHDLAVAAVEALSQRRDRVLLLIAGDGPSRQEVARLAARLGDRAVLTGHRDDVMAVLDAADVLLHPSRADAFPTALLEALAAGVPIVAADVGGVAEIVDHERTGLLVRPPLTAGRFAVALDRILADRDLRRRLQERGRERFEAEFTAARWASRLRGIYEQILC